MVSSIIDVRGYDRELCRGMVVGWLTSGRWTNPNSWDRIEVFVMFRVATTDSWIVHVPKSMSLLLNTRSEVVTLAWME